MELDRGGAGRRLLRPVLVGAMVLLALLVPAWLWYRHGRDLPLEVVLDAPRYQARPGERVPLRLLLLPGPEGVQLSWSGSSVPHSGPGQARDFLAPQRPGIYTVTVQARRSGKRARDSLSLRVMRRVVTALPVVLPPAAPELPPELARLPRCTGAAPALRLHGERCAGANLVLQIDGGSQRATAWLALGRGSRQRVWRGRWAELVLPAAPPWPLARGWLVPDGAGCVFALRRELDGSSCRGGPLGGDLFADFDYQLIGPGHVRLWAKPPRVPGVRVKQYRWDFGHEQVVSREPRMVHHFPPPQRPENLVWLEVQTNRGSARAPRLVRDRTAR